jgi:hypothetical protein
MIVNRLIAKLSQSYHFMSNLSITISVSIGISIFPADGVDANIIIKHAGAAMYKAKRDGKNGFCFYHNGSGWVGVGVSVVGVVVGVGVNKRTFTPTLMHVNQRLSSGQGKRFCSVTIGTQISFFNNTILRIVRL